MSDRQKKNRARKPVYDLSLIHISMEKSKQQKNKVRFVVVREFSGEKSMREAFEQLIERQTCEHFEEWRHQREMAEKAA